MAEATLQPIALDNYDNDMECLGLEVGPSQAGQVATNAKSLAEAKANPTLIPLAVYDQA